MHMAHEHCDRIDNTQYTITYLLQLNDYAHFAVKCYK